MQIIQKLLSTQGQLKLPLDVAAFESALRQRTYTAASGGISGYAFKFDAEGYAQPFYGRVGEGQFQLRPVSKGKSNEMENFLITGSYRPEAEGVGIAYTLSLNPKTTVLWLLLIAGFLFQTVLIAIFVEQGSGIFTFYSVAVPLLGLGWLGHRYNKMLAPSRQQLEDEFKNLTLAAPEAVPDDDASRKKYKSIIGTLTFMGAVFLLVGIGLGIYTYLKAKRATEPAVGVVEALRKSQKAYFPVISYTSKDGIARTYRSNYGSQSPEYTVGDTVLVYYDPAAPDTARLGNAMENWFFPVNFGMGGIVLLIIAVLGYRNRTKWIVPPR
jgi:hypothetical protein